MKELNSKIFLATLIVSTIGITFISYWTYISNYDLAIPRKSLSDTDKSTENHSNISVQNKPQKKATLILYWGYPWNDKNSGSPEGAKIGICDTTYDRNRIAEADAIVFHYTTIHTRDLPWKHYRIPNQLFVWWSAEGPAVLRLEGVNMEGFDGFFNWTWTYRRDADAPRSYGYRGNVINGIKKGKKAVWIVSKCDYTHGARLRMNYMKELQGAGLNFTGYGKCFGRAIPRGNPYLYETIKNYKFYLAFENALHCTDYITEKFWNNGLKNDAVPVVWGPKKEDLLRVAPLDSFIFVEDFKSPKDLAEYLLYLDKNDTEYRKYFRWREDVSMTDEKMIKLTKEKYPGLDVQMPLETLCRKILKNNKTKIISSLKKEFWDQNSEECLTP
ncbi:4-galactosyl-N-acetylglucosaminide 3-alpha-L-fucosyltransferase FUT6-like [Clavelina lepadiformis]|uniref:4-galactosyl-N-acetylglucosaminide 3-alpha-L-fucosyltransferase FUT6-like n=1 Tax=Clavelina lepadiformis TaxID=159417 RepID=UPI0040415387